MKIILGIFLFLTCILLGYILSLKFTKKRQFYSRFLEFNSNIKNEISFSQSTLMKIVDGLNVKSDFNECVERYFKQKTFIFDKNYLNKDEIDYFKAYLSKLGSSDKFTQLSFLDETGLKINKDLLIATENERKYKKLYIKLGFLLGLIALIICL